MDGQNRCRFWTYSNIPGSPELSKWSNPLNQLWQGSKRSNTKSCRTIPYQERAVKSNTFSMESLHFDHITETSSRHGTRKNCDYQSSNILRADGDKDPAWIVTPNLAMNQKAVLGDCPEYRRRHYHKTNVSLFCLSHTPPLSTWLDCKQAKYDYRTWKLFNIVRSKSLELQRISLYTSYRMQYEYPGHIVDRGYDFSRSIRQVHLNGNPETGQRVTNEDVVWQLVRVYFHLHGFTVVIENSTDLQLTKHFLFMYGA